MPFEDELKLVRLESIRREKNRGGPSIKGPRHSFQRVIKNWVTSFWIK